MTSYVKKKEHFVTEGSQLPQKDEKINQKRFNFLCLSSLEGHVSGLLLD